jgi:catechol 2,3-dioxygenase-like lactoylglutathione lyase family enzyme
MSATHKPGTSSASNIPSRLHHYNYTTQDPEKTRQFYEDVLGFPLIAFWCEVEPSPAHNGKEVVMGHSFYALADGSMLAFMHHADRELAANLAARDNPEIVHIAMKVTEELQRSTVVKLRAAGHKVLEIDHGFVNSIYFKDPDGLTLEYAVDPDNVDEIYGEQQGGVAHSNLKRYVSGDHARTNRWLPETEQSFEWK